MKYIQFRFFLLVASTMFLYSCANTDEPIVSSDASFVSLTFAKNDKIKNIETAVFSLQTNYILNVDSLPFNTRIDSVVPTFRFQSTDVAFLYNLSTPENDSTLLVEGITINFNNSYKLKNYASDQSSYKEYYIKVNVHKVEPELYVWRKLSVDMDGHSTIYQKCIMRNDSLFYYLNTGTNAYLYASSDGILWYPQTLINFPVSTPISDITLFKGVMYVTQDGDKIYSSSDAKNWTIKTSADYNYKSLLCTLSDSIYAIVQSKTDLKYRFASSKDGSIWSIKTELDSNFPVSDFVAHSFTSRTKKPKALVIGGKNASGTILKTRWSSEDGKYWINFTSENKTLDTLALGATVVSYDDKLLLFGKYDNQEKAHLKQSIDEGLTWKLIDATYNKLPTGYGIRTYQSATVNSKNNIYFIGGKENTTVFSDVWVTKLNRKSFLIQ